jgi:hypothetical protein
MTSFIVRANSRESGDPSREAKGDGFASVTEKDRATEAQGSFERERPVPDGTSLGDERHKAMCTKQEQNDLQGPRFPPADRETAHSESG